MSSDDNNPARLPRKRSRSGRFRTLSDLNHPDDDSDSTQESDYDGSESLRDAIDAIFKKAMEEREKSRLAAYFQPSSRPKRFPGTGRLLSGEITTVPQQRSKSFPGIGRLLSGEITTVPQQTSSSSTSFPGIGRLLSGEITTVPQQPSASSTSPQETELYYNHDVIFWRNGLIIDEEPLWRYDEREAVVAPFIESIKDGKCPEDLEHLNPNPTAPVVLRLYRRHAKYQERAKHHTSFKIPDDSELYATLSIAPPSPSISLVVDESLPSTSIQLRLADGTRISRRFNLHHTVGDIRSFIDASRPGFDTTYQLQAGGVPTRVLTDPTQTIVQAGLTSSVVFQKYRTCS